MTTDANPIALLRHFDERYRALGRGLPGGAVDQGTMWRGIGFSLGGVNLVAGMDQVREVLTDPLVSRVPGAKHWVRGLANVRGRLVTVVSLAEFLQVPVSARARGARALYVEQGDLQVGLLVDAVFGAKQLPESARTARQGELPQALQPYVTGQFELPAERWGVFEVGRVLAEPEFLNAAA